MPNRSLVELSASVNGDGQPVLSGLCDCGSSTDVVFVGGGPGTDVAFTCDGCGSTHWLTITVTQPSAG